MLFLIRGNLVAKTYSKESLWKLIEKAYFGYIRHLWDPVNNYYCGEDVGDSYTDASSVNNCAMMNYHLLHYLHQPDEEDLFRINKILEHVTAEWNISEKEGIYDIMGNPEKGDNGVVG